MVLITLIGKTRIESFIIVNAHLGNDTISTLFNLPTAGNIKALMITTGETPVDLQTLYCLADAAGGNILYGDYLTQIRAYSRRVIAGAINVTLYVTLVIE